MQFESPKELSIRVANEQESFFMKRRSKAVKILDQLSRNGNPRISFKRQSFQERVQILLQNNTHVAQILKQKKNPKLFYKNEKSEHKRENHKKEIRSELKHM